MEVHRLLFYETRNKKLRTGLLALLVLGAADATNEAPGIATRTDHSYLLLARKLLGERGSCTSHVFPHHSSTRRRTAAALRQHWSLRGTARFRARAQCSERERCQGSFRFGAQGGGLLAPQRALPLPGDYGQGRGPVVELGQEGNERYQKPPRGVQDRWFFPGCCFVRNRSNSLTRKALVYTPWDPWYTFSQGLPMNSRSTQGHPAQTASGVNRR